MPGFWLAIFLAFCVVFVIYWRKKRPLPRRPLNVDSDLPLPWLAQTSTVFSLTGLFGAYFGITVTLGLPALLGLAFGTVLGLFAVLYWIESTLRKTNHSNQRFEYFINSLLRGNISDASTYALAISIIQCVFAASELLIFRELVERGFGLKPAHANFLAMGVAVLGYCYVLWGGYVALFRTDMIQLLLVCVMAIGTSVLLVAHHSYVGWTAAKLWPRAHFWECSWLGSGGGLYIYHFLIATIMGLGLFLASPDTWKRVFQVNKDQSEKGRNTLGFRILTFLGVGLLPYLVLLPFAIMIGMKSDEILSTLDTTTSQVKKGFTLPPAFHDIWVFVPVAVGLVACFLSSFNSALLGSVHIILIWNRKIARIRSRTRSTPEEARFYRTIMFVLGSICLIFLMTRGLASYGFKNPWLLGNFLMGGYAIVAGVHIGTFGRVSRLPKYTLRLIFLAGLIFWVVYFGRSPGYSGTPTIKSVNSVPIAVGLSLIIAFVSGLVVLIGHFRRHK